MTNDEERLSVSFVIRHSSLNYLVIGHWDLVIPALRRPRKEHSNPCHLKSR